ncbi:cysteine peptidase family C39 domain-containing protein [Fluviicola taffensis]
MAYGQKNHFVILYEIKDDTIYVADQAYGKIKYNKEGFIKR